MTDFLGAKLDTGTEAGSLNGGLSTDEATFAIVGLK